MRWRPAGVALFLAALAGSAPASSSSPDASSGGAASHCRTGETIVYSCRFGRSLGSVCAAPGRINYRFGPLGRLRIEIDSDSSWSNVRIGRIVGGGGGEQNHLRFSAASHDYLVFEVTAGSLTRIPGRQWSGIHVQRGDKELATLACRGRPTMAAGGLQQAREFAPPEVKRAIDEDDQRFEAWY